MTTSLKARRQSLSVGGAAAAVNIPVAGIRVGDLLLAVSGHDQTDVTTAPTMDNLFDEASITSDGNIQCSTTDTTNFVLQVEWQAQNVHDRNPGGTPDLVVVGKQMLNPDDPNYVRPT